MISSLELDALSLMCVSFVLYSYFIVILLLLLRVHHVLAVLLGAAMKLNPVGAVTSISSRNNWILDTFILYLIMNVLIFKYQATAMSTIIFNTMVRK